MSPKFAQMHGLIGQILERLNIENVLDVNKTNQQELMHLVMIPVNLLLKSIPV